MWLTNKDLIEIGFKKIPTFTIGNTVIFDLGRNRQLSASNLESCNLTLWIAEIDRDNPQIITDLVCLHNYDYDGQLSIEKVKSLIELLIDGKSLEYESNSK